jgi:hypothetical protein
LALEKTIPHNLINSDYDKQESRKHAVKKLDTFKREVRKIEKYLAFALILKEGQDGTFGTLKVSRWVREGKANVAAPQYARILSVDGRYPNAVYRASARKLGIFSCAGDNIALIQAKLSGQNPFHADWSSAGRRAFSELANIVEFWEAGEIKESLNLYEAAALFKKSRALKSFKGFSLDEQEARFLFDSICVVTPYWEHINLAGLGAVFSDQVDFESLIEDFAKSKDKDYFAAAYHIDVVTREFANYYGEIARQPKLIPSSDAIETALPAIKSSIDWLDRKAKTRTRPGGWEDVWVSTYSELLTRWVTISATQPPKTLANELKARAEMVVASRGRGKEAPHQRRLKAPPHEDEIDRELGLQTGSFRLRNANRIFTDIAAGVRVE